MCVCVGRGREAGDLVYLCRYLRWLAGSGAYSNSAGMRAAHVCMHAPVLLSQTVQVMMVCGPP